jgi:hypothetical protein
VPCPSPVTSTAAIPRAEIIVKRRDDNTSLETARLVFSYQLEESSYKHGNQNTNNDES